VKSALISDLMGHLDSKNKLRVGPASKSAQEKIAALDIPRSLKLILQQDWLNKAGDVGCFYVLSVDKIFKNNDFERLLKSKMIPIGSSGNGDILSIDFNDENKIQVRLASHEIIWEDASADPRKASAMVTPSLEEFLLRVADDMYLPSDYYAAKELSELRKEMAR
jgi:hypothetical protein